MPTGAVLPPVERRVEGFAGDGFGVGVEKAGATESRGTWRLMRAQSFEVGLLSFAAWAMAGICRRRFVDPPKAAWTIMALLIDASERMSEVPRLSRRMRRMARAERRAASSQMGWPEGPRAECGRARPRASAMTCEVAAVPRNWQPPPGVAQARQPISAADSRGIWCWAKRAPMA